MKYALVDDAHCETVGQYETYAEAIEDIYYLASLDWDIPPNRCPCICCERQYSLVERDEAVSPPKEIRRAQVLKISKAGSEWIPNFDARWKAAAP